MTASRALAPSKNRLVSRGAVIAATVLGLASTLGSVWLVRGGAVIAVAGALVAVVFAFREVRQAKIDGHTRLMEVTVASRGVLARERTTNDAVVAKFQSRNADLAQSLRLVRTELGERQRDLNGLRGDLAVAADERATLVSRVAELERLLAAHEAAAAEVVELSAKQIALWSDEDVLWESHEMPSIVEMPVRKQA